MIITSYMRNEHRACDDIFVQAEKEVIEGNFPQGNEKVWNAFWPI